MNIDFHSHTLPFADHGCKTEEVSRGQMIRAKENGIDVLCITPHFYPYRHTVATHLRKKEVGKATLAGYDFPLPRLFYGAEVLLCEDLDRMEGLRELCFEGTNVMLLELPDRPITKELADTISRIEQSGIVPVLAHIERYPKAQQKIALEVCPRAQMNLEDMVGFFRKKEVMNLLKADLLYALGSDMHMEDNPYRYLPAVKKLLGDGYELIMQKTSTLLGLE